MKDMPPLQTAMHTAPSSWMPKKSALPVLRKPLSMSKTPLATSAKKPHIP